MTRPHAGAPRTSVRRSFAFALTLLLAMTPVFAISAPVHAATTFTAGELQYTTNDTNPQSVTVTGLADPSQSISAITIGASVSDGTDIYPITAIGPNAFRDAHLQTLNLSDATNLTAIEYNAFYNNQLTQVAIPAGITTIGSSAFQNNLLEQLALPDSVKAIELGAFYENRLTDVALPSSLRFIEDFTFGKNKLTRVTVPDSVTAIGSEAFAENKLTQVTFPYGLTNISSFAFSNNLLTAVTIPDSVATIGTGAFSMNSDLASAVFLGAAPTQFTQKGGAEGSLGNVDVVVYFAKTFNQSFTSPFWKGYRSQQFPELTYDRNAPDATGQIAATDPESSPSFDSSGVPSWNVTVNAPTLTRPGYTLTGWNVQTNGQGTSYQDGDSFTLDKDGRILYAQWVADAATPGDEGTTGGGQGYPGTDHKSRAGDAAVPETAGIPSEGRLPWTGVSNLLFLAAAGAIFVTCTGVLMVIRRRRQTGS